jgi:hypothetical protein
MSRHELHEAPGAPRRRVRCPLLVLILLALLVPYGLVAAQLWTRAGDEKRVLRSERDGAAYLGPLVQLIAATADAQTAAVAGQEVDFTPVRTAMAGVDDAEVRYGARLATATRWAALHDQLDALIESDPAGLSAYHAYGFATELEVALASRVGDSSALILDPRLDTYYLTDTVLLRLPGLLVTIGRLSDLTQLFAGQPTTNAELAAAAEQIRRSGAAVNAGLEKSFTATTQVELSRGLVPALDAFSAAQSALVPPSPNFAYTPLTPVAVEAARSRVRDAALALETAALAGLDGLLAQRADEAVSHQRLVLVSTTVVIALLSAFLLLGRPGAGRSRPRRAGTSPGRDLAGPSHAEGAAPTGGPAPGGALPGNGRVPPGRAGPGWAGPGNTPRGGVGGRAPATGDFR